MSTVLYEEMVDDFRSDTGEITHQSVTKVKKSRVAVTDEFVKVSKYLNTIFAFKEIPLSLVPISLLMAQRMEFKTNTIYLLKADKAQIAAMLDCSLDRVNHLIQKCKKHDIIRPVSRGKFEVNAFLFSTGTIADTRKLQAHFDFDDDTCATQVEMTNRITGETVRKSVTNRDASLPGQMTIADLEKGAES